MLEGEEVASTAGITSEAIALGDGRAAMRGGGSAGADSGAAGRASSSGGGGSSAVSAADDAAEWEIDASEIELGPRIGIGSYGEVFRGSWRHTDVAVKRFLEQDLSPQLMAVRFLPPA